MSTTTQRPIFEIAREIRKEWKNVWFGAEPYLRAMSSLVNITDKYGDDDAESVILYFLSNATYWRGEAARRIKSELNQMLKQNGSR